MKNILMSMALVVAIASACTNDSKENNTHTHDDGSAHQNHDTVKVTQEEFTVDSTKVDTVHEEHDHDHSDSDHKH